MLEFEKPEIRITDVSDDERYAKFVVEPLSRGYGTTVGNALKRLMISSLPGFAVSRVRIEGMSWEETTRPGIREDIQEIILNIKNLAFRSLSENTAGSFTAKLSMGGEGTVTAAELDFGEAADLIEAVDPVKYTKLEDWIARGKKGVYRVKRLKRGELPSKSIEKMMRVGRKYKGKRYDLKFQWSDDKMYCSELI